MCITNNKCGKKINQERTREPTMKVIDYHGEDTTEVPPPDELEDIKDENLSDFILIILQWKGSVRPEYFEEQWDVDPTELREVVTLLEEREQVTIENRPVL
ncbi:hypothetical protein [Haloarcula hispanica pleomorphic virus 4]|uniref:Uncharacterized protein n=1 Tax=Haloarcula hispanica pleomorphic virus 4 TaxID=1980140 RepID=A0A2P0QEF5_9VIRU|nr:hypothetical protein HOS97_gp18 [Haloarcula hispanica pleomorphic virus 4]ARM71132.1 hypothetical protein [Haloarcula hispanica pleomorphic virus 4]